MYVPRQTAPFIVINNGIVPYSTIEQTYHVFLEGFKNLWDNQTNNPALNVVSGDYCAI